jgi:fatty acid desaturase
VERLSKFVRWTLGITFVIVWFFVSLFLFPEHIIVSMAFSIWILYLITGKKFGEVQKSYYQEDDDYRDYGDCD